MKLSVKYKLSAVILVFALASVFATSFVTLYRNHKYFSDFFQKKSAEKLVSYDLKREKLLVLYAQLSENYETLYKTNLTNDFKKFLTEIKLDLIIESLPSQTEKISALSSKYKSSNVLIIEKNNAVQISSDINLWNKNIIEALRKFNIGYGTLKNSEIFETSDYYYLFGELGLKNGKFNVYFILSKNEIIEFRASRKKIIEETLENERLEDSREMINDKNSFGDFVSGILKINIVLNVLIFAAGIAIMIFSIKILLVKLNNILDGVKEAKNKNMSFRVVNRSFVKDEFDELTAQFNSMMEHIENEKISELISVIEKIMPRKNIKAGQFNIVSYYKPSKEIGGDFIDLFDSGADKKILVIADVVGKSFPAAFLMILAMTSIKLTSKKYPDTAEFVMKLNGFLRENTPAGKWITMIYAVFDLKNNEIEILNCGHPEAYLFSNNKITEFSSSFPMIGELPDSKFQKYVDEYKTSGGVKIKIVQGDILFLYTDGLSDSTTPEKKYFNVKNFIASISKEQLAPEDIRDRIAIELESYNVKDDLSFLIVKG
ncbi:MAG TPA: PP2C family protein-serine/threonine phosphatase [bacterium]|nr:PP2C family protein-serine/threonine phosphatase [bacterium]HPN30581.1 PP2C family protein-serine/threonine phosphatase [bacterium]